MAIDLRNIDALDTKLPVETFTKVTTFIKATDTAKIEDVKSSYLSEVIAEKADPQDPKVIEEFDKEDLELDKQIQAMVSRWLRTSKNIVAKEDETYLCDLAKKMYYERLRTGESRMIWRVLKEYITGVKSEMWL